MSGEENRKTPVTLISGFLGSGKTTFLNYILTENHGKKIAVIQNEFGQGIGIETAMIVGEDGSKVSEWLEFPNGCICCTVKDDFIQSIENMLSKRSFDYILIESTGMGDPGQISSSLWVDEGLESPIYLDSIITLVDSKNILKQIEQGERNRIKQQTSAVVVEEDGGEEEGGGSEPPPLKETEAERQIAFADVILLNKVDLVDEQQIQRVRAKVQDINPLATIFVTQKSVVDLDKVLSIQQYKPNVDIIKNYKAAAASGVCSDSSCSDQEHQHHNHQHGSESVHSNRINTICVEKSGSVGLTDMNRWIGSIVWSEYQDKVFRCKGLISIDGNEYKHILQGVYETFEILQSDIKWLPNEERINKLVFIGECGDMHNLRQDLA
ncbi:COBW domain-containing protein [Cavenderia fasciculata]|uniref:COBW domain-containing protein n=1 Tax=Cavenderia fasciculata TaxID=261658 RepID=F4PZU2_CACFS|nr:COBW domain-containing protein [Cavenderia fasciculata]EGG18856.1 COBW domain-containing protein [Cavenderia fasciculata]|eukprot:XP_004357318.1 COBW domain-containing protein [Cavenderia fasciculata]